MATRSETLEKFLGRRTVSCLGYALLIFVVLLACAVGYAYYKQQKENAPLTPNVQPQNPVLPPLPKS